MTKKKLFFVLALMLTLTGAGCITVSGGGSGSLGVYKSENKGDSWAAAMAVPTVEGIGTLAGVKTFRLHTDPSDPNTIYLASRGQGLYFTYDNGRNWKAIDAMAGKFIYGFAVDPKNKCVLYTSDGPNIYKSDDCGRTFKLTYTEQRSNQRVVSLAVDFGDTRKVYAAILGGDIMVSNDSGLSWRATKRFGTELQYLVADNFNAGRLYVATQTNGLYRSDDSGDNWTDLNEGLNAFNDSRTFYRLVLNPGQKDSLFWISKYGILRSDDAGAHWGEIKLLTPPGSVNIYAFGINPANQNELYYTGTVLGDKNTHIRSTFYKSVDGGKNWVTKKLPTNTIPAQLIIHPQRTDWLFMGFTLLN